MQNLTIRVSAPGKVILHGEHSVVYGKLALAASLGLRTSLEYSEEGGDGVVRVEFEAVDLLHFYDLQDIQSLLDKPLPLSKGASNYSIAHPELINMEELLDTVAIFIRDRSGSHPLTSKQSQALAAFFCLFNAILGTFDVKLDRFKVKVATELTVSAGTGSSASFAVTIAAYLIQYVKVKKLKAKKIYKSHKFAYQDSDKFDKTDLELISKWAFLAERIVHGTPSGVDNTVCTYGAMVEFYKGISPKLVQLTTKFKVILVNTNIVRDTRAQVNKVALMRTKHRSYVDGIINLMDETAVSACEHISKINRCMGDEFGSLEYYEVLEDLAEINQNLLRCLNVSHPKLEEACQVLQEQGLKGKLTGAGGGGFAIALVPPYIQRPAIDKVLEELNSKGFCAVMTDLGGSGVTLD